MPLPDLTSVQAPPDSPHASQLRRGFPWLRFEPALEAEFRQAYRAESLPQLRRNLWLAVVFVAGFSALAHVSLAPEVNRLMDLIRVAALAPILLVGLAVVHSGWYHRRYPLAAAVGAPIFGVAIVVLAVIAARHGVNMISTVVITTIYIYFMLGVLFYAAFGAAAAVFASYLVAAPLADLATPLIVVDVGVLVCTNVIGAMVCYSLERSRRTNFLEERLLIETASRDGLTGIRNRRMFDEHVDRLWREALRDQTPLALLLIDIDHFKAYNDYYGHQAGDERLRRVAWALDGVARRPLDLAARYGGEEFAIVLYDVRREHVEDAARRIQASIAALEIEHLASPASGKRLTVSVGAACVTPSLNRTHYGFIQLADEALYAAKERGRNCVVVMDKEYEQLTTGSFRRGAHRAAGVG
jgi:diguanylate cyclase (GGDEF)-like protein